MMPMLPDTRHELSLICLFMIMVFAVWKLTGQSAHFRASPGSRLRLVLPVLAWQALMAVLALAGYFSVFSQPWRALPTVGLTLAVTLYGASRPGLLSHLRGVPDWAWPAMQSFRLPLEMLLYNLYLHGVIGRPMTFAGNNFDILAGLSAPLMAWVLFTQGHRLAVQRISVVWNGVALILLFNILIIAVLSVPFPFQVFTAEPANRMVAGFPFVWLPTFFIPLALFCHLVALRVAFRALRSRSQ